MPYIKTIEPDQASGKLKQIYDAAARRTGRPANIIKTMSLDGNVCHGSMMFYVSLMKSPNALAAAQREMIAAVVSNYNDCYY